MVQIMQVGVEIENWNFCTHFETIFATLLVNLSAFSAFLNFGTLGLSLTCTMKTHCPRLLTNLHQPDLKVPSWKINMKSLHIGEIFDAISLIRGGFSMKIHLFFSFEASFTMF